jgi:pentatricopeptide repeat protein
MLKGLKTLSFQTYQEFLMSKVLNVPYFSQRDNAFNPSGSCNVTSCAMALHYWGIRGDGSQKQLEDQLYKRCEDLGLSRHAPYDLKALIETYPGCKDYFEEHGTLSLIRSAIDKGQVCIVHGYSTGFGHIFVISGYDDTGFICQDPWGEWSPWFYTPDRGKDTHYSNRMIAACCSAYSYGEAIDLYNSMNSDQRESATGIWLHRVWRKLG